MMKNLLLSEGDLIQAENVSLSIATFAKFQPQSTDFLDISNPKAVYPFFYCDHFTLHHTTKDFCIAKTELLEKKN